VTKDIEIYWADGCGRCARGGTPECSVHFWTAELQAARALLLEAGFQENIKWGSPTYLHDGKVTAMLYARRESCDISFFRGAMLDDPRGLLEMPGPNSRLGRVYRITGLEQFEASRGDVLNLLEQAKAAAIHPIPERLKEPAELPEELAAALEEDPSLASAFFALTPGRQRGWTIIISGAKQSATRLARIQKAIPRIFAGQGPHDR
jgi:uncharacterized protein YdeI (YjbR/CyaY-like superfamily)